MVTAAQCVNRDADGQTIAAKNVFVHLGQHDIQLAGPNTQQIRADRIILHDGGANIALIRLADKVTYTDYVRPICLYGWAGLDEVIGKNGISVGWRDEHSQHDAILNQVSMPVVSDQECVKSDPAFYEELLKRDDFYCAGFRNGSSVCTSDIGAGLYFQKRGSYALHGIVSNIQKNATNFCDAEKYVVFTEVGRHTPWIEYHTHVIPEIKVCDSDSVRFTLKQLNDVPGKNRWLGKITAAYMSLAEKTRFHLELDTYGRGPQILKWDRDISALSIMISYPHEKYDSSVLVERRDILYFDEERVDYSFTGEASSMNSFRNRLEFVIEFAKITDYPIVKRLSVLDTEVCREQQQVGKKKRESSLCDRNL